MDSPAVTFLLLALFLIATELIIMQFSFFWFFFLGLAALITAAVGWLFPELSWGAAIGIFLVNSLAVVAVLLPRLKRWQNKPSELAGHDAIGQKVEIVSAVAGKQPGKVLWSGAEWTAYKTTNSDDLAAGDSAIIVSVTGIHLTIKHSESA